MGYNIAISVISEPPKSLPRLIEEDSVVGLLAIGGGDITDEFLTLISDYNMPLVTVDNESYSLPLNNVVVDSYRGGHLAVQHLIDLGHKRIAIIRGPEKYKSLTKRYHGYLHAMIDSGLGIDNTLVQESISKGMPNKGYLEMQALLKQDNPPTAVFAVTDRSALGAIMALEEAGLSIPDDMSIVGFDDIPPHTYSKPALTSVTSERFRMGRIAMQRLHKIINEPDLVPIKIVVHSSVVVRDTSADPR